MVTKKQINIFGEELKPCCIDSSTGFFRDGYCHTNDLDQGKHTICAVVTKEFLEFSKFIGNDLSTPRPESQFHGLKEGDTWCLCALRWKEACDFGIAPQIRPESTSQETLKYISKDILMKFKID